MQGSALTQLAHLRHAEPLKLISLLRGDLDWIVIRALEKDRSRRYQTANNLATDVERFLDNEPVEARPPSRLYRLQKLVRRNKVTCVAGALVALALVVGLGMATWFWLQEREARKRAVAAEQQALAAEREQTLLLREAEDRERIAQAAYLMSQNKFEEADSLASKVLVLKPSLEAEKVLRDLGWWHVTKGEWAPATERFKLLLQVDQRDNSWTISDDLLMAGPILIERGDMDGYEQFRRAAIAQFAQTADPIFAERTLKISLLLPADGSVMKSVRPLSDVAVKSLEGIPDFNENMVAWRCISVALMAYRGGDMQAASTWCERCLSNPENNPARIATARVIRAMALYRAGAIADARTELTLGRQLIETEFATELTAGTGSTGWWYDWLFARILLREAEGTIQRNESAL